MTRSGLPSATPWRLPAWLSLTLIAAVATRVGAAVIAATKNTHGDYYASLPGPYVRTLNPVLWDSPDLQGALWLLVHDKKSGAAAVLACVTWFKYIPVLFGLPLFFNNNVPGHAWQVAAVGSAGFRTDEAGHLIGLGFCQGWFPPHVAYVLICIAIAARYLWIAIEMSIVTTVCACFFFSHYYYLILLVMPLNVLLARYVFTRQASTLAWWGVSYFLIAAFVVPTGLVSRLAGIDVWERYIWGAWFLPGELLLMWLLLREYRSLAR